MNWTSESSKHRRATCKDVLSDDLNRALAQPFEGRHRLGTTSKPQFASSYVAYFPPPYLIMDTDS
jgi:hypothetical protein